MKIVITLILSVALLLWISFHVHAASYLQQSRWISRCYAWGAEDEVKDADTHLVGCMNKAGYVFCPDCVSFAEMGGPRCRDDKNAHDRPACWRDRDPFHPRVDPSFDDIFAPCSSWSNVNCWEQSK